MKKSITYCLVYILILMHGILNAQSLIPAPQKVIRGNSKFQLSNAEILISKNSPLLSQKIIDQFTSLVKQETGIILSKTTRNNKSKPLIVLNCENPGSEMPLPREKSGNQSREAYQIRVTADKLQITAKSDAALFYALQTLQQLLIKKGANSYIQEIEIEDYPAFAYRGVMMDFSHGGLLTEEEIKNQIDFLSRWKMNQYYFYNEVSIEMKGYPLINYNARYSQEQIKRIIAYAREKHIDVIPFVEFYGHLHELLRLEKYTGLGFGKYGHDLDPRNPGAQRLRKNYPFLSNLL